jgi:hypothetical protein
LASTGIKILNVMVAKIGTSFFERMAAWLLLVLLLIYDFIQEVFAAVC